MKIDKPIICCYIIIEMRSNVDWGGMYQFNINKEIPKPIYLQLKEQLLEAIDKGLLQPGQKVPSTREISSQFGVSRMTVLQALRELTYQGVLFTVSGKGTFVGQANKLEPNLRTVWGFTETFLAQGYKPASKLISFKVTNADKKAADALHVPEKTPLFVIVRKRMLDDQPVGIETTQLTQSNFPGLEKFDWNSKSLYSVMREHYHIDPICGYNYIEAAAANEEIAHLLSIPKNSPVLSTERITCQANLDPIEYVHAYYRSDRLRLKVESTSDNPTNILSSKLERG
jgi:GntR family transcriptional regulator